MHSTTRVLIVATVAAWFTPARAQSSADVFQAGYGQVGALASLHGWGSPVDIHGVGGGVHLSGYAVLHRYLHAGLFVSYARVGGESWVGPDVTSDAPREVWSVGVSAKSGLQLNPRVWLGVAADLGANIMRLDAPMGNYSGTWYGLHLFPRAQLDVLAAGIHGARLGFFAALGPAIVPWVTGSPAYYLRSSVMLELLAGVALGR